MQALQMLLADGIVDEVLGQLKSGKEADVWLVRHNGETVAAKIYKEREFRSFKNNAEYKEGRQTRNSRTQRAMNSGSRFGQKASEEAWKASEADTLAKLHASGARVPKPVLFYEGVLLMEVVIDAEGRVAPRLVDAIIEPTTARAMYEVVREQAIKMLCADLIHGDLSEFNVLLAHDGPVVIDFPQVVSAASNSRSEHFFKRDLENVRRFFAALDPTLNSRGAGDADEIWRAYVKRDLSPDFVPSGRAPPPPPPPQQQQQNGQQRGDRRPPSANRGGPQVSFRGAPPPQADSGPRANQSGGRGAQRGEQNNGPQRAQQPGQNGNRNSGDSSSRSHGQNNRVNQGHGGNNSQPNASSQDGSRGQGGDSAQRSNQGAGQGSHGDTRGGAASHEDSRAPGGDGAQRSNGNARGDVAASQGGSHAPGGDNAQRPRHEGRLGNQNNRGDGASSNASGPGSSPAQGRGQAGGRPPKRGQNGARDGSAPGSNPTGYRVGPPNPGQNGRGTQNGRNGNQSQGGEPRGQSGPRSSGPSFGQGRPEQVSERQPGGGHRRRRRRYF